MLEHIWKAILRRKGFGLLSIPAFCLWVVAQCYRLGGRVRQWFAGAPVDAGVPVISVGNITVGGSGKTPLVGMLARELLKSGLRVGIVSSGYGRTLHKAIMATGEELQQRRATETGDEMLVLAYSVPEAVFSIDRSKAHAARTLGHSGKVDLILVDDGFQHRKLKRDYDIAAFDTSVDPRFLRPFPYGVLREPLTALTRAHTVILTRVSSEEAASKVTEQIGSINSSAKVARADFKITELVAANGRFPLKLLQVRSAFLFAGIGSFEALVAQVKPLVRKLDFALELADHQRYDRGLLKRIKGMADRFGSECLLTTGKDWVKAGHFDFGRESYYLELNVELEPSAAQFVADLIATLNLKRQDA